MYYGIEACALALLRSDPEIAVPLSRLHERLLTEAGPSIGPYGALHDRVRKRPDLFILLEPGPGPWDTEEWPEELRRKYRAALREAGLEPEPRVVPRSLGPEASASPEDPLMRELSTTLIDLWDLTADDPDARSQIADAFSLISRAHTRLHEDTQPREDSQIHENDEIQSRGSSPPDSE